ncbi:MAG: hypothetical protein ACE5KF_03450 [Kiloniellaceae bacterium]
MSHTTPPPAAIRLLPVGETFFEAYGTVFSQLRSVFKAAAVPFVLSILIVLLSLRARDDWFLNVLLTLLSFAPYTIFGVAWHRLTLLGPATGTPPLIPGWRRRHWRFFGYALVVILTVYALSIPFVLVGTLLTATAGNGTLSPMAGAAIVMAVIGFLIGVLYVVMRLSFVFPAVAVDERYALRDSWRHTRNQGFRLLGAVILTALPMVLIIWAVSAAMGAYLMPDLSTLAARETASVETTLQAILEENAVPLILSQLVLAAVSYVLMALVVAVISIAFRTCTGWVPARGGPPAATPGDASWNGA